MLKTIEQSIPFPTTAKKLYQIYTTPKLHAAVTGHPVTSNPS